MYHNFYQDPLAEPQPAMGPGRGPDWGHWVSKDFLHWPVETICVLKRMLMLNPLALPRPTAAPTATLALSHHHCRSHCHSRTACLTRHILAMQGTAPRGHLERRVV